MTESHVVVDTRTAGPQRFFIDPNEELCAHCGGAGFWDSCFDCGNRGVISAPPADLNYEEAEFVAWQHRQELVFLEGLVRKLALGLFVDGAEDLGMWLDCGDLNRVEYQAVLKALGQTSDPS